MPRLPYEEIAAGDKPESSEAIKKRVEAARERQRERFGAETEKSAGYHAPASNARMGPKDVRRYCIMTKAARGLFKEAFKKLSLSARSHDKILKVALTIADLEGSELIGEHHLAEAIQYRSLDRNFLI